MIDNLEWAKEQWGECKLNNVLRTARAVEIGQHMVIKPEASLPQQMASPDKLAAAYRLINSRRITMKQLLEPHLRHTLSTAAEKKVVLFIHDKTMLDFTAHQHTKNLGGISCYKGQHGLIMGSVLAIEADQRHVLGLGYVEMIVRPEKRGGLDRERRHKGTEGRVWENGVKAIGGNPHESSQWINVSDRESDIYEYMRSCQEHEMGFVLRAKVNRALNQDTETRLFDYVRSLPANESYPAYEVEVDASSKHPKRKAKLVVSWSAVEIKAPQSAIEQQPIVACVVRVWEVNPPANVEAVEWILLTSLQVQSAEDAKRVISYYECRWMIEDFHMCLKTGCKVESSQLDDGRDLQNLLGFALPIAVHLLQMRQIVRNAPDLPAQQVVDPVMLRLIMARFRVSITIAVSEFWLLVARLGGYVANPRQHPPGWRTIWRGWQQLLLWSEGARLIQDDS